MVATFFRFRRISVVKRVTSFYCVGVLGLLFFFVVFVYVEVVNDGYVSHTGEKSTRENGTPGLHGQFAEDTGRKSAAAKRLEFEQMCPEIRVKSVSCSALFHGDSEEMLKVRTLMKTQKRQQKSPELYVEMTRDCDSFKRKRGYVTKAVTTEEDSLPIAYTLLLFKDVEQADRLLRAVYRPNNVYCIHVDVKATSSVRQAVKGIADCFTNVFMSERSVSVTWGTFSILEPEVICMKQLWEYKKWKYFINLTGQEFPLKTNFELVKILTAYNGANDVEGTVKRANQGRWQSAGAPPHNITAVKGSVHVVLNRAFVDYVLHNETALDFLEWVKVVDVPDEVFFSTLNHNPHLLAPGSYLGELETDEKTKPFITRFKNWGIHPFNWPCAGTRVRLICIFGIGDLPLLITRREMFANKFYWDFEPYALDCMEELHYNKTRDEYIDLGNFNDTFYRNLAIVKNKVPIPLL